MAASPFTTRRCAPAAVTVSPRSRAGNVAHKIAGVPPTERLLTIQACSFVAEKAEGEGDLDVFYDRVEAIMGLAGLILAGRATH